MAQPAKLPAVDWDGLALALKPENSPGFLLWQAANGWQRAQRATLKPLGLTHVQFVLLAGLAYLIRKEGEVTQARLATFCRTDAMMTSQVLRALEKGGLVRRNRAPTDHRSRLLALTPPGVDALNAAMPRVLKCDHAFFGALGQAEHDVVEALRRLIRSQAARGGDS